MAQSHTLSAKPKNPNQWHKPSPCPIVLKPNTSKPICLSPITYNPLAQAPKPNYQQPILLHHLNPILYKPKPPTHKHNFSSPNPTPTKSASTPLSCKPFVPNFSSSLLLAHPLRHKSFTPTTPMPDNPHYLAPFVLLPTSSQNQTPFNHHHSPPP